MPQPSNVPREDPAKYEATPAERRRFNAQNAVKERMRLAGELSHEDLDVIEECRLDKK